MNESTNVRGASLAEVVRATQDVTFNDASAERIATILTRTKDAFGALSEHSRFDHEPADLAAVHRRVAPGAGDAS